MAEQSTTFRFNITPLTTTKAEVPQVALLGVLAVVASVGAWVMLGRALRLDVLHITLHAGIILAITAVAFFFVLATVGLIGMLVHDTLLAKILLLLNATLYLLFFGRSLASVIAFLLLVLAYLLYDQQIKGEQKDRIRFSVVNSLRPGLGMTMTIVLIAISLTFYNVTKSLVGTTTSPLDDVVRGAASATNRVLAVQVPGYNPDMTLNDFVLHLAYREIQKHTAGDVQLPDQPPKSIGQYVQSLVGNDTNGIIAKLPASIKQQLTTTKQDAAAEAALQQAAQLPQVQQAVNDAQAQLLDTLKIDADGSARMGDVVQQYLNTQIHRYVGPYEKFFPSILALSLYFTLQVFSFVYSILIGALTALLLTVLRWSGVVHIRTVDAKAQYASLTKSA